MSVIKAVGDLTYQEGERVLTRHGWGTVTAVRQETYPPDITDEVTFECTVRLDKPTSLGNEEAIERNPYKLYRYALFSLWWNIGDPGQEGPTVQHFTEEESSQAELEFESAGATTGKVLILILVDYNNRARRVRFLTADGEVSPYSVSGD